MAMAKRIFLFLLVNILVMVTITTILHLLGVRPYLNAYGLDYEQLAIFCLVWGMGGSMISLLISRIMAKMFMGVKVIDPQTRDSNLQNLVQTVHNLARSAGLPAMPEVGIYDSPEINAFATGPMKSRSLVAVSSGLYQRMNQTQLEGVLGHEIAHIANGDMVTMTLLQGVVNAFVMFLSRVLAYAIMQALRSKDDDNRRGEGMSGGMYFFVQFFLEIILMILGSIVVAAFSRWREFRADQGGARLAGRDSMISALEALRKVVEEKSAPQENAQASVAALKISGRRTSGLFALFMTHPPLEDRIARLRAA
jgi:heat shock protein HtpX